MLANSPIRTSILEQTPMQQLPEMREVVAPTLLLASDEASYTTGHALLFDGADHRHALAVLSDRPASSTVSHTAGGTTQDTPFLPIPPGCILCGGAGLSGSVANVFVNAAGVSLIPGRAQR
jgi:hypothetical protein